MRCERERVRERERRKREKEKERKREREGGGGQLFCEHAVVRACRDAAVEISN